MFAIYGGERWTRIKNLISKGLPSKVTQLNNNWLEACPLARWQVTEEKKMTDHTQVTIRFKVPKKSASEHLVDGEA